MRRGLAIACLLLLALAMPAVSRAHRLDEYLQATTLSLTQSTVRAELHMTPGVAVFPRIMAIMDTNRNRLLSEGEQRAYAELVLQDQSLMQDGHPVPLRLVSLKYPKVWEMRAGQGDIQLNIRADLPSTGGSHTLVWENRHQRPISVYLANCLVPDDPHIAITGQHRNYLQTHYELNYTLTTVPSAPSPNRRPDIGLWVDTGRQFLIQGIFHIFTGPDHILFIVGLLLLGGTVKQLLQIVTAFTVAHSVTLCLATLHLFNPPARIIEPTIAISIVFVGVNSLVMGGKGRGEKGRGEKDEWKGKREQRTDGTGERPDARRPVDTRLLFAFVFGFIHGFGFANALQELELPRQALVSALFAFNLGVECGQACIVLTVAPLLALLHRQSQRIAQKVIRAGSICVIAAGTFWFVQRILAG